VFSSKPLKNKSAQDTGTFKKTSALDIGISNRTSAQDIGISYWTSAQDIGISYWTSAQDISADNSSIDSSCSTTVLDTSTQDYEDEPCIFFFLSYIVHEQI
jgi:hypothetical protein